MVQSKPILIDAVHITMGGGKSLLDYLCEKLVARQVQFVLLRDIRNRTTASSGALSEITIDGEMLRRKYYAKHRDDFSSVLCFANIPPAIKLTCPVYTYFHNINLLQIPDDFSFKRKVITLMKRFYIALHSRNTNAWIVQTTNTEEHLRKVLPCTGKDIFRLPFYRSLSCAGVEMSNPTRDDYVLIGDYTGTRGHDELLKAWKILNQKGFDKTLHLTVAVDNPFSHCIDAVRAEGVNVVNHGVIPFEDVIDLYHRSKATIYPSKNESLGLGIVEAIEAGCDVIGANLPYIYSVCEPSVVFDSITPDEIVSAVIKYEDGCRQQSSVKINDNVNDLINCILGCQEN